MALKSPHHHNPINWYGTDAWIPYAWDETSGTTDWTCFDSAGDSCKEHYVIAGSGYGIPVSSISIGCSLYQSGVGAGNGAVIAGVYIDGAWAGSSTKVKGNGFSFVGFQDDPAASINTWSSPSSHTISFRIKVSGTTKGVTQLYDFYVKGR